MLTTHTRHEHSCAVEIALAGLALFAATGVSASGFDENFQVFRGDIDNDGYEDLYVKQRPQIVLLHGDVIVPISIPPDVGEFVLRQKNDNSKSFEVFPALSAAQSSIAQQWPAANVELRAADFNFDGYLDLGVAGVSNVVTGANDQIVFADQVIGAIPSTLKEVDAEFKDFLDDVYQWYIDDEVYDVEITYDVSVASYYGIANDPLGFATQFSACEAANAQCEFILGNLIDILAAAGIDCVSAITAANRDPNVFCIFGYHTFVVNTAQQTLIVKDLSDIHPDAADVINTARDIDNGIAVIEDIADIFEIIVGIDIGGAETPSGDDDLDTPDGKRGFDIHVVLADVWGWIFRTSAGAVRQPDSVYVTGHRVFFIGPFHTAIEYTVPVAGNLRTLSARPANGYLASDANHESERHNVTLGTVTAPLVLPGLLYADMVGTDGHFLDTCLDYDLFPQIQNGYNSNSYVHGLILATDGSADIDLNKFVGGSKPVPNSFFAPGNTCP